MALSRLDLPRIADAINVLYRTIETPPAKDSEVPAWATEVYKQVRARGEPAPRDGVPVAPKLTHANLIYWAAAGVLYEIMPQDWCIPPLQYVETDCPAITESCLDQREKVRLLKLWKRLLSRPVLWGELAKNRGDALKFLDFLESVLKRLQSQPPKSGELGQGEGADAGGVKQREKSEKPAKRNKPIPTDEANIAVRNYLEQNADATARDVARICKIALGRVSEIPAWRAHLARKEQSPHISKPKEARQLKESMLRVIGKEHDPSAKLATCEELAWEYAIAHARTPEEQAKLDSMTPKEKAEVIEMIISQLGDKLFDEDQPWKSRS
jgi:hypothetical protein